MQAIETHYNGYRFRSRLEARWAVFMDTLGVKYEYEPEGYNLGGLRYLPDFYLPEVRNGCFIEIKGQLPTPLEERKAGLLAQYVHRNVFIFWGGIPKPEIPWRLEPYESSYICYSWDSIDFPYWWCICPVCGRIGIEFDGRGARVCGDKCCPDSDKKYTWHHASILSAYDAARAARFEFGR